jgi:hypothetical protein
MNARTDTERILDAYLAPEADRLADRVVDAALSDIARTPQRRALRAPWRFPFMPAFSRLTGIAAAVLVVVVGAGALVLLNSPGRFGGPPAPSPTPAATSAATAAPTAAPGGTPAASEVAPGITGWTTYTSDVYGFSFDYPHDWYVDDRASREWRPGDSLTAEAPYDDQFASPEDETVGLFVWQMPAGEADVESWDGLTAWAVQLCRDIGAPACDEYAERAVPMCHDQGGCRAALLVPMAEDQWAFVPDWESLILTTVPDVVTVFAIGRPDDFPSADRYGGSVELLKSILSRIGVETPTPGEVPT